MITKIEVDGFKSLKDFDLKLKQGVNILVGPNGAGKTNIILFFEFLSNLLEHQVGNAVSYAGGAGSIFQKIGRDSYNDTIKGKIHGSFEESTKKWVAYEYGFEIKISFEKDNVFYTKQHIKARLSNSFSADPDILDDTRKWDVDILFRYNESEKVPEVTVGNFDKFKLRFIVSDSKKQKVSEALKDFLMGNNLLYNSSIKTVSFVIQSLSKLYIDLKGGETFNIVPSKVRELEDSATPPGINKDGSGLATTLYAMKKNRSYKTIPYDMFYMNESPKNYNPQLLDKIVKYLKAANSTINNLSVENDPFNNRLAVKINIKTGNYESLLPLSSMSDGTIKWLTLITAILTSKTIFSIEEPENFLHPWMQAEIVKIMRNHLEEKKHKSFVLMTTHSESLLNQANPEELIVVNLANGKTNTHRVCEVESVKEEISKSGFGLGHFYFSNALNND